VQGAGFCIFFSEILLNCIHCHLLMLRDHGVSDELNFWMLKDVEEPDEKVLPPKQGTDVV
jgi:hypothetical protein